MNRAPTSTVIPVANGGHGQFTWERSRAHHYYRVRRGAQPVASVSLNADLPGHARIMDGICRVLDQHEGDDE